MPENFAAPLFSDDQPACDLVIDSFDQMHNSADLTLLACHFTIGGAASVAIDPAF